MDDDNPYKSPQALSGETRHGSFAMRLRRGAAGALFVFAFLQGVQTVGVLGGGLFGASHGSYAPFGLPLLVAMSATATGLMTWLGVRVLREAAKPK